MIELTARIEKHPMVVYRELGEGEGGVLLHLATGQYFGLNLTGALIWSLLDGQRTPGEIAIEVRSRLSDAPVQAGEDVVTFLQQLRQRELVQVVVSGTADA